MLLLLLLQFVYEADSTEHSLAVNLSLPTPERLSFSKMITYWISLVITSSHFVLMQPQEVSIL